MSTLNGTTIVDALAGGSDDDLIFGNAGDDTLFDNGGNDSISGGGWASAPLPVASPEPKEAFRWLEIVAAGQVDKDAIVKVLGTARWRSQLIDDARIVLALGHLNGWAGEPDFERAYFSGRFTLLGPAQKSIIEPTAL